MARFKLARRLGLFGKINIRNENHGDEKVPAADIKVVCLGTKRDLDMLFPLGDVKISDAIYDKEGHLLAPWMSPMKNHRKPEGVQFTVWDQPTNGKNPLSFDGVKIKIVSVELKDKRNIIIELTIQLHDDPDKHTTRLRRLMDTEREFELIAQQDELFDQDPEGDDQDELDLDEEGDDE